MYKILITGGLIIFIGLLLSWGHLFPRVAPVALIANPNDLPGIETGGVPWALEISQLRARLTDIGLPALDAEGTVLHIHQHIDLMVNGSPVTIPAGIGINEAAGFISPVHTHDTSGIIHVESNIVRNFTLGEFFDVWGVRFTKDCIGEYCATATSTLRVYANGLPVPGDPRSLVLTPHQEIVVVYGTKQEAPKTISSSYAFPPGY